MNDYTLVLPMAGDGARFGGTFKPLLKVRGQYFVEAATNPFLRSQNPPQKIVLIYRKEHEERHAVGSILADLLSLTPHEHIILDSRTSGPLETVRVGLRKVTLDGPVVICDCDHQLDVEQLVTEGPRNERVMLPLWPVAQQEIDSWAVAQLHENRIVGFYDKAWPPGIGIVEGVIGCYWFPAVSTLFEPKAESFVQLFNQILRAGQEICHYRPRTAFFFGDPVRLRRAESGSEHDFA